MLLPRRSGRPAPRATTPSPPRHWWTGTSHRTDREPAFCSSGEVAHRDHLRAPPPMARRGSRVWKSRLTSGAAPDRHRNARRRGRFLAIVGLELELSAAAVKPARRDEGDGMAVRVERRRAMDGRRGCGRRPVPPVDRSPARSRSNWNRQSGVGHDRAVLGRRRLRRPEAEVGRHQLDIGRVDDAVAVGIRGTRR